MAKKKLPETDPKPFKGRVRRTRSYERQEAVGISLLGPPPATTYRPVKMLKISEDIIRACGTVLDLGHVHAYHAAAIAMLNMTNKILEECGHEPLSLEKLTSVVHFKIGVKRGRGIQGERWHEIAKRNKLGPYSDKAIANKAKRAMADASNAVGAVAVHEHEESAGSGSDSTGSGGLATAQEQVGDLSALVQAGEGQPDLSGAQG